MAYVLDADMSNAPAGDASSDEKNVYQTKVNDSSLV
jgi:hypothetical protein